MAKNGSILSQKVPKFELYKHNDELVGFFQLYVHDFYSTWNTYCSTWMGMLKIGKSSKFLKNPVINVEKLIIMLIQFKFGHFLAWTFAYFDRLCKLEKRGDEIKKNSFPLKLLSQSQPNFAEMILRNLKGDHLRIISAKFGWDWLNSFREDFF
jgi:hypothetical protein